MTTPSIPGFQWLEQLGDGPCGQIHRFTPVATDPRDEPVPVVAVFYHPEGIDPDLLTRQWQEMFAAVAPPGILLPLSWQFTGPKLTALWPDLDRPDALETPAASRANPQTPFTKVRIKPRHSRHTDASGDGPGTAGFNGRLSRWLESPVGRNASGSERTRLTSGLLEAGSWLHQRDLIHGNLKPDNIWLRPAHDGFVFPLLLNIGTGAVGRIVDLPWSDHLLYMPAEQLVGRTGQERHPNAKGWDVHAMGVILHRIWTGRLPRFQQWLESHGNQSPPSDQWRTDAGRPPFLDWGGCSLTKPQQDVVARCLEPDPAKRWQDLEQLAKAWEQALMEASPAAAEVSAAPTVPSVPSEPSVTSPEPATAAPAAKAGFAKSLLLALACMAIWAVA